MDHGRPVFLYTEHLSLRYRRADISMKSGFALLLKRTRNRFRSQGFGAACAPFQDGNVRSLHGVFVTNGRPEETKKVRRGRHEVQPVRAMTPDSEGVAEFVGSGRGDERRVAQIIQVQRNVGSDQFARSCIAVLGDSGRADAFRFEPDGDVRVRRAVHILVLQLPIKRGGPPAESGDCEGLAMVGQVLVLNEVDSDWKMIPVQQPVGLIRLRVRFLSVVGHEASGRGSARIIRSAGGSASAAAAGEEQREESACG